MEISNESSAYHDNYVIKYYLHSFFITLAKQKQNNPRDINEISAPPSPPPQKKGEI